MPDTSETNSVDTDEGVDIEPEHDVEWALKDQPSFRYDNDLPLYDAWAILHAEVRRLRADAIDPLYKAALADRARLSDENERLQKVVADQALTICALQDVCARHHTTIEGLDSLLKDERSLTAAAAQHTTALERRVAELQAELDRSKVGA